MDQLANKRYRLEFYDNLIDCLLKGGFAHQRILKVLLILYNKYCDDYTEEALEEEIRIHHSLLLSGGEYKLPKRNLQQEIENLIDFWDTGDFPLVDVYNDLKLSSPEEKATARQALNRLVARGLISKIGEGKTGRYHIVTEGASETKFLTEPVGEFNIKLPLELSTMCKVYPKNIIIIAGSKSSGKTALLLNIAMANQNKMPVVYLNSEMGDEEFTDRMIKMGCTSPEDIKFKVYNKSTDYHDMVNGNKGLYIIDFLEIHDKFYEIGKPIRAIHEKLKEGVAIIAIQMKGGSTIGRGGDFSKEKARLYLSMDYVQDKQCSRITIEEMKSPKNETGYRGWHRDIKIINGSRLSPIDGWSDIKIEGNSYEKKASPFSRNF